jgi:predicted nucleotidyltransferase
MEPGGERHQDLMRAAGCAAEILARDPRVQLVYLFGSVLDPDRPVRRDIDIAVLTIPALPVDSWSDCARICSPQRARQST